MDYLSDFLDAMAAAGLGAQNPSEITPTDGRWKNYMLEGDKKKSPKGGYRFTVDADGAVGQFKDRRVEDTQTWTSRAHKSATPEEKAAYKQRIKAMRAEDEKKRAEEYEAAALEAKEVWKNSTPAIEHPYLKRKKIQAHGARINADGDLILPRYDFNGKLWSYQSIDAKGDKKFQFQGRASGVLMALTTKDDDRSTIIVTEGFATGASEREATGYPVMIAFTAGNLLDVAKAARKKFPDAEIILAADNDQFTFKSPRADAVKDINKEDVPGNDPRWNEWRDAGYLHNTGIEKATEAAFAVNGRVMYPEFLPQHLEKKPTDYNDYAILYGDQELKNAINAPVFQAEPEYEMSMDDLQAVPDHVYEQDIAQVGDYGLPFKILGFNEGKYYYMPFVQRQIVSFVAGGHSMNNLLQLASLKQWEAQFDRAQHNKIPTLAADLLMDTAHKRGVFYESDSVRGSGLWADASRLIYNSGKELFVNGEKQSWERILSKYVYVSSPRMPLPTEPLSMATRQKFIQIFTSLCWENPLSGILLAGWIAAAPICSTFAWRPHIWITGEAMSGKTTVLEYIRRALAGVSLNFDGNSTEPKIREAMGYNVQPIVFDEAENKSGGPGNMLAILELARLSSKGGNVAKFGQKNFKAQSMFCFAGINPPISGFADETRISRLVIKRNRAVDAEEKFMDIKLLVEEVFTEDFSSRLVTTLIAEYKDVHANFNIFFNAAREKTKDPRAAEQIGVLLSGYWLMFNGGVIAKEKAVELVGKYEWNDHTAIDQENEQEQLLHHIATSVVRVQALGRDVTIGELIEAAAGRNKIIDNVMANNHLKSFSIKVDGLKVYIGNTNKNLSALLRGTVWGLGWGRQLSNLEGSEKLKAPVYFSAGDKQRSTSLPLSFFLNEDAPPSVPPDLAPQSHFEEIPF